MTAPTMPPSTPPAIVRSAQERCLVLSENGELPRHLVVIVATPGPDASTTSAADLRTVRYAPETLEQCVARLTEATR